jgi:Secretion system C-terminal sorting domain
MINYMKRICFLLSTILCMNGIYAQSGYYDMDYYQSPYQFLDSTKATLISTKDSAWLYWEDSIPIGFDFELYGETYDSVLVYSEGVFDFFQDCPQTPFPLGPELLAFLVGTVDRGNFSVGDTSFSDVSYVVEGQVGQRILKVEWKNMGLDGGSGWDDYFNYQVWFYENGGIIEIHFGPYYLDDPKNVDWLTGDPGPLMAFRYEGTCEFIQDSTQNVVVFGNSAAPQDTVVGDIDFTTLPQYWLSGMPPNGIVYRFRLKPVGIENIKEIEYSITPNPANNQIQIRTGLEGEMEIVFYDLQGRAVLQQKFYGNTIINTAHLPQGLYPYRLTDSRGRTAMGKVVILR